jgi:thiol-disulfide isomerase/thioredoxin
MSSIRARAYAAAFLVGVVMSLSALGQDKPAAKASPGADKAEQVMARVRKAYADLKSYHETASFKYTMETEEGDDGPSMSVTSELTAAPGHKLRLTSENIELISDGKTAWIVSPKRKQYVQQEVKDDTSPQGVATALPEAGWAVPPSAQILWRADKPLPMLTHQVTKLVDATPETRAGEEGMRVTGDGTWLDDSDQQVKISLWFSDKTGLLGEYVVDLTDMMKKQAADMAAGADDDEPAPPKIKKALYVHTFDNIRLNEPVQDEVFTYKPPEDFKKVDEFKQRRPGAGDQLALLGKPAPLFSGHMLDEKDFSLDGLQGKVVLLDFWATWCGPCVMAIPHIQDLSKKYADKPVVVIGVNQDQGAKAKVTKFLEKKSITIRQYMDDGSVGEKYSVTGIPCMVLIDKKGSVQEVKVGFGEGEDEELAKDIDKLLEGKDLRTPQEIAELQKKASEGDDDDGAIFSMGGGKKEPNPLADVNPQRLVAGEATRTQAYFYGTNARSVDIDGDGKRELVAQGMMGGLDILSSDASSVKHIKLEGQSRMSSVTGFEPLTIDGKVNWLVATTSYNSSGRGSFVVGLYKDDGAKVWTYTPEGAEGLTGQVVMAVGDLDGDSKPEIALGISLMKYDAARSGRPSMPTMYGSSVVVLDLDGKELVRRDLKGQVTMVAIGSPKPGEAATLACFVDGKLVRFTYNKDAKPQAQAGGKEP